MDPAKLKVVDLRQELQQRGLDPKGNKAVLVKRLKDAMGKEINKGITSNVPTTTTSPDESFNTSHESNMECSELDLSETVETPTEETSEQSPSKTEESAEAEIEGEQVEEDEDAVLQSDPENDDGQEEQTDKDKNEIETSTITAENNPASSIEQQQENDKMETNEQTQTDNKRKRDDDPAEQEKYGKRRRDKSNEPFVIKEDEPEIDDDKVQLSWYDSDLYLKIDKTSFTSARHFNDGSFGYMWAGARSNFGAVSGKICYEVKITEEFKWEGVLKTLKEREDRRDRNRFKVGDQKRGPGRRDSEKTFENKQSEVAAAEKVEGANSEEAEKNTTDKINTDQNAVSNDQEQQHDSNETAQQQIDSMNNLNNEESHESEQMNTNETGNNDDNTAPKETAQDAKQEPVTVSLESATDTTQGENQPALSDDVLIAPGTEDDMKLDGSASGQNEQQQQASNDPVPTHYFRIGFSLVNSSLQLGESKNSFAYESTGRFLNNKEFEEYGITFGVGDVIAAYLNISDEEVSIAFSVNGVSQSEAVTVPRSEFPSDNFALFPHILCRNYAFEVNFGNNEEPWFAAPEEFADYQFLQTVENKLAGPKRPATRAECEFIFMVGLPGSGKTHWVNQHLASSDKTYTIIGNDTALERMTVDAESILSRISGSWKVFVDRFQRCLNVMSEIGSCRRRHFIIDQTNVFPQAQNRKLRAFEGFKRKAVCLVCEDEELKTRQKQQHSEYAISVPEGTFIEQKGAIELPDKLEGLEFIFPDLDEDGARRIIRKYHQEFNRSYRNRMRRDNRRNFHPQNQFRDRGGYGGGGGRRFDRQNQGNWNRQGGGGGPGSGGGGGGGGGGWGRDRRDNNWNAGGRQGGGGGGGNQNWRANRGQRSGDRRPPRDGGGRNNAGFGGGGGRNQGGGNRNVQWPANTWNNANNQGWNQQMFGYGAWPPQGQQNWKYNNGQGAYMGNNIPAQNNTYGQQAWSYYGQYGPQQGWGNNQQRRK